MIIFQQQTKENITKIVRTPIPLAIFVFQHTKIQPLR